jgi:hypothetical protein
VIEKARSKGQIVQPRSHYLSYNEGGMLRGRKTHVVLPLHISSEHLLYNEAVTGIHFAALQELGLRGTPMLNFAAVIHSGEFSHDQSWHADAPYFDGIKVQVPLIDIPLELGPIEIKPERNAHDCPIVAAATSLGDAILYRHLVNHRGMGSKKGVNKTALDLSYMFPDTVARDDFLHKSKFPPQAYAAMKGYRLHAAAQCRADGLACAIASDVEAVQEGPPYSGPLGQIVRKDGFIGSYQGSGTGHGTWVDPNGSLYEGDFVEGNFHGRGTYVFTGGNRYSGEFKRGLRNGRGVYEFSHGETYDGDFVDNQRHGQAVITAPGGHYYEGEIKDGIFHKGTLRVPNGPELQGQFVNGVVHGECKVTSPDGFTFVGVCRNGSPHGPGLLRDSKGNVQAVPAPEKDEL